jgi:phosphoglycerol transferase MdoB-like AlkP superfamily enzyme
MRICDHSIESAREHLKFALSRYLVGIIIAILIMIISRVIFLYNFAYDEILRLDSIFEVCKISLLFDIKYASIIYAPTIAFGLLCCFKQSVTKIYHRYCWCYDLIALLIVLILSIVNYYYYKTYNNYIDTFIFSFFKEDPKAVISTIIKDYPIFKGIALLCVGVLVYMLLLRKILIKVAQFLLPIPKSKVFMGGMVFVLLLCYVCCCRGSFSVFPLRQNDVAVTNNNVINASVLNGPAAFGYAYKWYKKQQKIPKVTIDDLMHSYKQAGLVNNDTNEQLNNLQVDIYAPLKHKTRVNEYLNNNKPHVVFTIMESMSTHLLGYDNENFDVYGSFREHAKNDYFFLNFISEGNGTIDSITRLMLEVPDLNLSTTSYVNNDFITNVIKPYKRQGYKVKFLTSGLRSWRSVGDFLQKQGFDEILDKNDILIANPNAEGAEWGLYDEFLFEQAYHELREAKEPTLLVLLSITNHAPYQVPDTYKDVVLKADEDKLKRFKEYNQDYIEGFFNTFRYANDKLGLFISKVKSDKYLSDRTIIAATGDHNIRGVSYSNDLKETVLEYAVPFYMYLPKPYQNSQSVSYDKERFGSHKDIFTTLIEHSLSDEEYYSLGCDLLSDEKCKFNFSFNDSIVIINDSFKPYVCFMNENTQIKSIELIGPKDGYSVSNLKNYTYENNADFKVSFIADPQSINTHNCNKATSFINLQKNLYYFQINQEKNK